MTVRRFYLMILTGLCLFLLAAPAFAVESALLDDLGIALHGFLDARSGTRLQTDPHEGQASLNEARLQLDVNRVGDWATLQLRSDFVLDSVTEEHDQDFEEGTGIIDLREANLLFSPHPLMDVKLGRQILTWGTGDLLFINDLFPKDWQSFFIGRDEEYLKAPSDAVMVSLFPSFANIDLVYTPRFDSDRFIRGERLSYYNSMLGRRAGQDAVVEVDKPDEWFSDDEWSLRMSRNLAGYEVALYGYSGYWKSPAGMDPNTFLATFPALNVYGASLRGALGSGLFNLETGYYDSRDDRDGNDPLLPNSEWRWLAGYERELARDFTGAFQYYVEALQDYDAYRDNLPDGQAAKDQYRQVLTMRLTKRLLNQNLTLSLFTYWSPSDQDGYLRPNVAYKVTDALLVTAGANLFFGSDEYTFFDQFAKNNNIYAGIRYSF